MTANMAVRLYRLIPPEIRGLWRFAFPTSTSHLYENGMGWCGIRTLMGDSKVPRPPMPD